MLAADAGSNHRWTTWGRPADQPSGPWPGQARQFTSPRSPRSAAARPSGWPAGAGRHPIFADPFAGGGRL